MQLMLNSIRYNYLLILVSCKSRMEIELNTVTAIACKLILLNT